ncbi:Uma2 family endonuclease [Aureimonas psammosilenae]|uniref:Uma2 family endonuclease n=1 Tax=Aureimonas psammosilenae TaxID=2495496 RepID=UPI001F3BFA22|nr:Uma2 family endonuclease [Aureimonas psammosilenae]
MAAEAMPRRAWTVAEVEAMVKAGILSEDERFEMIGGEVVPMSPKGARHEWVKVVLNRSLQRTIGDEFVIAQETTLRLDERSFLEPDFCLFPALVLPGPVRGPDVLLAIEVADSSLLYDTGRKISIYAAYGIPEVWVVNAKTLETLMFRTLGVEGYRTRRVFGPNDQLMAGSVDLSVTLAALGLTPAEGRDEED